MILPTIKTIDKTTIVITCGSYKVLSNYDTIVAVIENDKVMLGKFWNLSKTTAAKVAKFLDIPVSKIKDRLNSGEFAYDENLK